MDKFARMSGESMPGESRRMAHSYTRAKIESINESLKNLDTEVRMGDERLSDRIKVLNDILEPLSSQQTQVSANVIALEGHIRAQNTNLNLLTSKVAALNKALDPLVRQLRTSNSNAAALDRALKQHNEKFKAFNVKITNTETKITNTELSLLRQLMNITSRIVEVEEKLKSF